MAEPSLDSLRRIFSFEIKKDLERYCRNLTVSSDDFFNLVLACELSGTPFLHAISYRNKVPSHLVPKDSEIEALKNAPAGTILSGEAAKAASKMSQSFEDRRYLVGHMFFSPDRSRWHFFCFDQRDLRLEGNHWEKGSHVHFVNWLWSKLNADSVWSNFVNTDDRPGAAIHLRFVEPQEDERMKIVKCKFTQPVEKRSSTGLYPGMFNENVSLEFEVEINSTKREHIEEMLNLFERAAADFKETWQKKLAGLH
jgi:hypothetical protein